MEVSQEQSVEKLASQVGKSEVPLDSNAVSQALSGDQLIRSISAIAGLGEESVKSEVAEMLSLSGQPSQSDDLSALSLEQLRAAMLVYLETINADMESGVDGSSSDSESDPESEMTVS